MDSEGLRGRRTPIDHLRHRYGRRAEGHVPEPDCELCRRFVTSLPVRWLPDWLRSTRGARYLMDQRLVAVGR